MADESITTTATIDAGADVIFGVLADPVRHVAIDGTGRVREAVDRRPLTAAGQIFRMDMYHENHPDGGYRMANRVQVFDPPVAIAWQPGHYAEDGSVRFGGWFWRYDLASVGLSTTTVTLTYDWSAVPDAMREHIGFPPFPPEHLGTSLTHLAALVTR